MTERCDNCRFWFAGAAMSVMDGEPDEKSAPCRRHAPVPNHGRIYEESFGLWPLTMNDAWCGEYEGRADG